MLLLDDDDVLASVPGEAEALLAARLGSEISRVDDRILSHALPTALKVARIVHEALDDGGFDPWDDGVAELHTRRVIGLVEAGRLEAAGNVCIPRFSEVWLPAR